MTRNKRVRDNEVQLYMYIWNAQINKPVSFIFTCRAAVHIGLQYIRLVHIFIINLVYENLTYKIKSKYNFKINLSSNF